MAELRDFKAPWVADEKERDREFAKRRFVAKSWRGWYNLALWRGPNGRRTVQLATQPYCERCLDAGRGPVIATVANHKIPHKGNWDLFIGGELESVCKDCHDIVIQAEERRAEREAWLATLDPERFSRIRPSNIPRPHAPVTLVCGPPGSGKSTYVDRHKGDRDRVIDFAFYLNRTQSGRRAPKTDIAIESALNIRNARLRQAAKDKTCNRIWFVFTGANPDDRKWWSGVLGAEAVIVIETPKRICKARMRADWTREITIKEHELDLEQWFMDYERRPGEIVIGDN